MAKKQHPKFTINNFRIFDKPHTFELAPITILTGPNNSGKSSLVKALLLLNNNKSNGLIRPFLNFEDVDSKLYNVKNIFNNQSKYLVYSFEIYNDLLKKNLQYNLSYENDGFLRNFSITYRNKHLISYDYSDYLNSVNSVNLDLELLLKLVGIQSGFFDIIFSDSELSIPNKKEYYLEIEKRNIVEFRKLIEKETNPDKNPYFYELFLKQKDNFESLGDIDCFDTIYEINNTLIEKSLEILKNNISQEIRKSVSFDFELVETKKVNELKQIISNFIFIKLDSTLFWLEFEDVSIKRSNSIRNINLKNETTLFNRLLKRYLLYTHPHESIFHLEWFDKWLSRFGIGEFMTIEHFNHEIGNVFIHQDRENKQELSALGSGVVQILIMLLLPLLDKEKIERFWPNVKKTKELEKEKDVYFIYLEEPESNLHPNWQSLLMELITEINQKFGIRFILETHSEYMIRKLQSLVAKKNITNDEVKIYYFNSDKYVTQEEPKIKEMILREDGILANSFGPGFFDESVKLTVELLKIENYN